MRSSSRPTSSSRAAQLLLPLLLPLLALAACSDEYGTQRTHSTISVEPLALDFGRREAGESVSLPLKVSNTGSTTLHVSRSFVRNDTRSAFSAQALPAEVAAGASVTVEVTYRAPDAEGPDGAQFVIESDADNAPEYVVSLTGRAADQCLLGQRWCDGACVDTAADSNHCGDCATVCQLPQKCLQGRCGCEAKVCATNACGEADDGCGQTLSCGECASPLVCIDQRCLAPTCTDHLKDGEETDVDCGGPCSPCALGKGCATLADCEAGLSCIEKVCSHCRTLADCPTDQVCRDGICGACLSREECGGGRACLGGRCLSCPDEASFNECGLCGGAPVSYVGAPCAGPSGCEATYQCNAQRVGVECPAIAKNECGKCGGTPVADVGGPCTNANGCPSKLTCAADQLSTECTPVAKDECGVCAGTATGIDTDCSDPVSGCPSKWACVAGEKTCTPVAKDACGVCGGTATDIGTACADPDSGCPSQWACVDGKKTCTPVAKDECGVCGGASTGIGSACTDPATLCASQWACIDGKKACTPVARDECNVCGGASTGIGTACTDPSSLCASQWACIDGKKACTPVAKDACGACGGTATGIGTDCTDPVSGCLSKWACVGTVKTCTPVARDACGACGGTATDIGADCTDPGSGCLSKWACAGTVRTCTPVARDACGACGGTATGIGTDCTDPASGCPSKWACVGTVKTCTPVAKNACELCGGPAITNLPTTGCTSAGGCAGTYQCSADQRTTFCDAPASCAGANHLVISQICGEGPTVNDDYVEIYNPTSSAISVSDHRIFYRNTANTTSWTNQIQLTGSVPAHGWFLVSHSLGVYAGDVKSSSTNFGADGGQMMLWKGASPPPALPTKNDSGYVDLVGYGTAAYREGSNGTSSNAPAPGTGGAIVRKANPASTATSMATGGADALSGNGTDTDDNAADFVRLTELKPRTTASTPRP